MRVGKKESSFCFFITIENKLKYKKQNVLDCEMAVVKLLLPEGQKKCGGKKTKFLFFINLVNELKSVKLY